MHTCNDIKQLLKSLDYDKRQDRPIEVTQNISIEETALADQCLLLLRYIT